MKSIAFILLCTIGYFAFAAAPATQPAGDSPTSAATPIIREGSYIVDRTGQLSHSADGQQWQFIFDESSSPPGEPTINILPNLNLMLMENAVASNNQIIHFKVAGMVTEYRSKNYLLLQKVMVVR